MKRHVNEPKPRQPKFRTGEIWSVDDLLSELKVADKTFRKWVKAGLRVFRPATLHRYVMTDDLIRIWAEMAETKENID